MNSVSWTTLTFITSFYWCPWPRGHYLWAPIKKEKCTDNISTILTQLGRLTNQYQSIMTTTCKQIKFPCFSLNSKNQKSDKSEKLLLDIPNVTYWSLFHTPIWSSMGFFLPVSFLVFPAFCQKLVSQWFKFHQMSTIRTVIMT